MRLKLLVFLGLALMVAPVPVRAAVTVASGSGEAMVDIDQGFWDAHVVCRVFSDDPNSGNPAVVPGEFTYVYTVRNDPNSQLGLREFRAGFALGTPISGAGWVSGSGDESPTNAQIQPSEVQWPFSALPIAAGEISDALYLTSSYGPAPGFVTVIGEFGAGSGSCLVPAVAPIAGVERLSLADTFLRSGVRDRNEGANRILRVRHTGHNRGLVRFDLGGLPNRPLRAATLTLTIDPVKPPASWGKKADRSVNVYPLLEPWVEGDGRQAELPNSLKTRGFGSGATWKCAADSSIEDQSTDCDPTWNGSVFGPATATPVIHTNGLLAEIHWDVTADVAAALQGTPFYGWVVKKTAEGKSGAVRYYSREGAAEAMNPGLGPRLLLEFD